MVVTCLDGAGRWRPGVLRLQGEDHLAVEYLDTEAATVDSGVVTGGFTDWHVHLHLINRSALAGTPITRVHDLGGSPGELQRLATPHAESGEFSSASGIEVLHAGAFLTPPGGYPSDRAWAPPESYREVTSVADARTAVGEMASAGASAIKVASNSESGPVFSDEIFTAIVAAARDHRLPVVAHAEGRGEAVRAARLGASRLAHAPFTEVLSPEEITELAVRTSWCSTLDIHGWGQYGREHEIAVANVAAFVRAGGRLLYGTDMGNGPTPVGLNVRELESLAAAGLSSEEQLTALTPVDPRRPDATLMWVPRDRHGALDVRGARGLQPADLASLSA